MSLIWAMIALIIAGALAATNLFIGLGETTLRSFPTGTFLEITYQFLLVTVIGGAIAYLYREIDRRREQRRELREMHSELLEAYNSAKTVRRQLRARLGTRHSVKHNPSITASEYEEQMKLLSDAQLTFEVYSKRAKEHRLWFVRGKNLASYLETVENYLNGVVKEYQEQLSQFAGDPPMRELSELKKLSEFIGPHEKAHDFQNCFQNPTDEALEALGEVILR
jgi:hypothetical protein